MDRNPEACDYFVGLCVCRPRFYHGVLVQMVRKAHGQMEEAKFIKQRSDPNTDRVEIWKTKFSADLLVRMKLLTLTSKYCSVFISDMLKLTKNN